MINIDELEAILKHRNERYGPWFDWEMERDQKLNEALPELLAIARQHQSLVKKIVNWLKPKHFDYAADIERIFGDE